MAHALDSGVTSEGFSSTALPARSACAVGLVARLNGPFQGVITPTTPSGRYTISRRLSGRR
jgi:hypothetical protein